MLPVAGEQDRIGDDEVFGACQGSCAEFASTGWNQLALKPANLGLEAAAGAWWLPDCTFPGATRAMHDESGQRADAARTWGRLADG